MTLLPLVWWYRTSPSSSQNRSASSWLLWVSLSPECLSLQKHSREGAKVKRWKANWNDRVVRATVSTMVIRIFDSKWKDVWSWFCLPFFCLLLVCKKTEADKKRLTHPWKQYRHDNNIDLMLLFGRKPTFHWKRLYFRSGQKSHSDLNMFVFLPKLRLLSRR